MLELGARAPDFTLPDASGEPHRLGSALANGPVVLAFLKADCAVCHLAFPYLERMHQAYGRDGLTLWGISQHPARAAEWFAKTTGVTFRLLIDGEAFPVSHAYDPDATPTILLLDGDGAVRMSTIGLVKQELNALAGQVAAALGKEAVVIAPPDDGKPSFRPG